MFITKAKHQRIVSSLYTEIRDLRQKISDRHQTIAEMAFSVADRQGALEYTQRQLLEALATIEALRPKRDARGRFI